MDINAYKFVFRRSETSRKIYIKIHANNTTTDIYSVYVCSHRRLFFFSWNSRDINTHKIYNLTPDFKSKLFKCNNHILIKSSANKRSLNQLIGPAWKDKVWERWAYNFLYSIFRHRFTLWMVPVFYLPRCKNPNPVMLPQPIKLGLISDTFYILEYLLKQLQTMF